MKTRKLFIVALIAFVLGGGAVVIYFSSFGPSSDGEPNPETILADQAGKNKANLVRYDGPDPEEVILVSSLKNNSEPLPNFMGKSLDWMAQAQAPNGGYGAGLHSMQHVRDPHAVKTDPATSALVGLAFVRTGSSHQSGPYASQVNGIMNYLLEHIEKLPKNPTRFTDQAGTQPQSKLGSNIDATFTSQFLTRMLEFTVDQSELNERLKNGVEVCVQVIESQQNDDGSFQGGTWAGVLQSSMANSALEKAEVSGLKVDKEKLKRSRNYQRNNFDTKSGKPSLDAAAGVSLYAISSTNRASATNARKAMERMEIAKDSGVIAADAEVTEENLQQIGLSRVEAEEWANDYRTNEATRDQLQSEEVLSGFGNNGGEEFISYMMTSESLVITGGDAWDDWNEKMMERLSKIQNPDGSWSGHHCITSPVFCTAAVIMTLATDRDVEYIAQVNATK